MSAPKPIGPLFYDQARAVKIREPENLGAIHSAVHSALNVTVDTKQEADAIIDNWPKIMEAAARIAQEILEGVRVST